MVEGEGVVVIVCVGDIAWHGLDWVSEDCWRSWSMSGLISPLRNEFVTSFVALGLRLDVFGLSAVVCCIDSGMFVGIDDV